MNRGVLDPQTNSPVPVETQIHPYQSMPASAFWSRGVVASRSAVPADIYTRKWPIARDERIATAGSCFAQHIGRRLKARGYRVLDLEPAPRYLPSSVHGKFGYSIYSARFGNIYTMRQLLQLAKEALGQWEPGEIAWQGEDGAWYDALRPGVEPSGLGSRNEVLAHRAVHLARVREMFESMDLFIFTLGLTEAWEHRATGTVFPTAPGTIAGQYDPEIHAFHNFRFDEIWSDFVEFRAIMSTLPGRAAPPRFFLTVSPVPLTASASGKHVMQATVYSKSVLRAVAGQAAMEFDDVDYFPSYEIITSPWSGEMFYEQNLRSVKEEGVNHVMQTFFLAHLDENPMDAPSAAPVISEPVATSEAEDLVCEEALLDAFGRNR